MRQPGLYGSGGGGRDAAGLRGARDGRRSAARSCRARPARRSRSRPTASRSPRRRSRCRSSIHELHRGERRLAALRRGRQRQAAGADPRDGRHDGKLGPAGAAAVGQAPHRALRHARRGLLGEDPRAADDRHDDRRPDRAARRARHHGEGRARRHRGRRRDRAAYGVPVSASVSRPPSSPARRPRSRRPIARPCWRASRSSRREGVRTVADETAANGYPEELRGDRARFEGFRARWLANDPSSFAAIYRMLAGMDLAPELAADQMPGAGDRRRVRPRPPAEPRRADRAGDSRARSSRCSPSGTMRACRRPS